MPAPIDFTGARIGRLTVLGKTGYATYGGMRQSLWQCRCRCGATLTLPRAKLPASRRYNVVVSEDKKMVRIGKMSIPSSDLLEALRGAGLLD